MGRDRVKRLGSWKERGALPLSRHAPTFVTHRRSNNMGHDTVSVDGKQAVHSAGPVERLAERKKLPAGWLTGTLGVRGVGDTVRIPYFDFDGEPLYERTRNPDGAKKRFHQPAGTKLKPYGRERLGDARKEGLLFLAEGESDCWTLWHNECPALALPGHSTASALCVEDLVGIGTLYVTVDRDKGAIFVAAVAARLRALGWRGKAYAVRFPPDVADVNDLHARDPDNFLAAFTAAVKASAAVAYATGGRPEMLQRIGRGPAEDLQNLRGGENPPAALPQGAIRNLTVIPPLRAYTHARGREDLCNSSATSSAYPLQHSSDTPQQEGAFDRDVFDHACALQAGGVGDELFGVKAGRPLRRAVEEHFRGACAWWDDGALRGPTLGEFWLRLRRCWALVWNPDARTLEEIGADADHWPAPPEGEEIARLPRYAALIRLFQAKHRAHRGRPFTLTSKNAGDYLGVTSMQAWRMLGDLSEEWKVIKVIRKGTPGRRVVDGGRPTEWAYVASDRDDVMTWPKGGKPGG